MVKRRSSHARKTKSDPEHDGLQSLQTVQDEDGLQRWKVAHLGRSAPLMQAFDQLGKLSKEERPAIGRRANEVKRTLESAYAEREQALHQAALARSLQVERLDVTLPGRRMRRGGLHPATQTLRRIYGIFAEMGFQVYRSREVETGRIQLRAAQYPRISPGAGYVGYLPHHHAGRFAAHPHLAWADPRHARASPRADPGDPAWDGLPLRAGQRTQGNAVQPGGRPGQLAKTSPLAT